MTRYHKNRSAFGSTPMFEKYLIDVVSGKRFLWKLNFQRIGAWLHQDQALTSHALANSRCCDMAGAKEKTSKMRAISYVKVMVKEVVGRSQKVDKQQKDIDQ